MKKRQKLKKKEGPKVDGLSAKDVAKIRSAIRQVWHRSHVRKLCIKRATGKDGFFYCESCFKKTPKINIDHIEAVGKVDGGFIKRLFCSSSGLTALCISCHREKTNTERRENAKNKKV